MKGFVSIAIDGPSGVGKSTVARRLAARLGYNYIDTGAMFRTISVLCLDKGIDLSAAGEKSVAVDKPEAGDKSVPGEKTAGCDDPADRLREAVCKADIGIRYIDGVQHMLLDGEDVTARLRTEEVSRISSIISAFPFVRERVLGLERGLAAESDVIMDGRDIGTVVLPDAQLKIFLTASPKVRAERRYNELEAKGMLDGESFEDVLHELEARDARDLGRETAPLRAATDAVVIDTSSLTIDMVEERIINELKDRTAVARFIPII